MAVAFLWMWLIYRAYHSRPVLNVAALTAMAWLTATWLVADAEILQDFESLPPLMPFLGAMFALTLGLAFSAVGTRVAEASPFKLLIGFQMFRFPLELAMHQAAGESVMPMQMSFAGYNFDILSGITALLIVIMYRRKDIPRGIVIAWNLFGSLLLLNILVIAIASTPMFQAFGSEPERVNTFVTYPPFVWLPAVMVAAAVFGHVVLWRKLGMREKIPGG